MIRNAVTVLLLMLSISGAATQVTWDMLTVESRGDVFKSIEFHDHSFYEYQVFCDFVSGPWGHDWSLTATEASSPQGKGGFVMYKAEVGSIVNHDSAQQPTYFVNVHGGVTIVELAEVPWTPLTDPDPTSYWRDEDVYLAIIMADSYGKEAYGWIHLRQAGIDGKGSIFAVASAIDLDGGPMIVGGGAWEGATPEPASGVLLLLGGALLALRRRPVRRRRHAL